MDDYTLVLNAGSSSLKFCVYERSGGARRRFAVRGQIEGIGAASRLTVIDGLGNATTDEPIDESLSGGRESVEFLLAWLGKHHGDLHVRAVGHRVVHGGRGFSAPCIVTPAVLAELRALVPLAPLHQPHNIAAIEAVHGWAPDVPQVACFDTSFHRGQSAVAELVPLPRSVRDAGVQRYGFHGLSYEYTASVLSEIAPEVADGRVIVAHLGNGASLCVLRGRRSVDCTFGFTALDGLCMGTRPGSVDPGVILHLFQSMGRSAAEVERMLYEESGLLGISGISNDMRDLVDNPDPAARLAVDYFVYQAAKCVGALVAVLGGVDALVFTAGIGEHSAAIRQRIGAASAWLGVALDPAANDAHATRISRAESRVTVLVIPTNEELMIAHHTDALLGAVGCGDRGSAA